MAENAPIKHHYVPQFYMRQFACADNARKVMTLECHCDVVVADRKSIEGIGWEERLHDYDDAGAPASIEGDINRDIETPFFQQPHLAQDQRRPMRHPRRVRPPAALRLRPPPAASELGDAALHRKPA